MDALTPTSKARLIHQADPGHAHAAIFHIPSFSLLRSGSLPLKWIMSIYI